MSFNTLQDFYGISHNIKDTVVSLIINISSFWEENKDMWFSHEPIVYFPTISTMYEDCKDINYALILQYDQIFRHPCKHIQEKDKTTAYRFASSLALNVICNGQYNEMTNTEKIFTLLTLRHNASLKMKKLVLKKALQECFKTETSIPQCWLRFIKATIIDIDNYKVSNIGFVPEKNEKKNSEQNTYMIHINERYKDILEMKKTVQSHFKRDKVESTLCNEVKNLFTNKLFTQDDTFAVSISGGVDSMVLSYITNKVCKKMHKKLILVHICYNNRDCCSDEINMLKEWASLLDVELYIRTIDEITRDRRNKTQFRSLYEDITRHIRFSFYKYIDCPILLGHNRDDTFENMFSNLSKGIHFDNLSGMSKIGEENDIFILRPFLSTNKDILIEYADSMNIPHLYDSTPPWSRRGKTRDELIPSIKKFDKNILRGLEHFSHYTEFLHKQWEQQFTMWNSANSKDENENLCIKRDTFFNTNYKNLTFWIKLWFDNNMNTRPSNKSFMNLIHNITCNRKMKCDMNYKYQCCIDTDTIQFVNLL